MVANENGGPPAQRNGSLRIIGKLLGDQIPEKSLTAKGAAEVDEFRRRGAGFEMSIVAERLTATVSIIDNEGQRANQKTSRSDGQLTAGHHFRQFAPKNGHRRANQAGKRPDKDRFIPKGQSQKKKSERKIP